MEFFERPPRRLRPLLLTPLVDVFFLLIIFFLLTTSFIKIQAMELGLPGKDDGKKVAEAAAPILIDVAGDGGIYWQHGLVFPEVLRQRVANALKQDKHQTIVVRSGKDVSVQKLVSVLDLIYMEGGRDVSVDRWNESDRPAVAVEAQAVEDAAEEAEKAVPVMSEKQVEALPVKPSSPQEQLDIMLDANQTEGGL